MENISLSAITREGGKAVNAQIRKDGKIPAVIYGGKKNISVAVDAREFKAKFHTVSENHIVDLDVDGKVYQVLIKDYQKNWLKDKMIHIDFYEVTKGKELKTHVPVKIIGAGKSVGEKAGGLLEVFTHELEVSCLPKNLPEEIDVDVTALNIGESIHVSDMKFAKTIKVISSPETVIAMIERAGKVEAESTEESAEEASAAE